jgi:hypothetical protein
MAHAATRGDIVQSDNLGMNLYTHNLDTGKTTYVTDSAALSAFLGLHYYVTDSVRLGMNLQFTGLLSEPAPGGSRFSTFALLPQVGWNYYGPLFAAFVFTIAPRFGGANATELGVQGVFGVSLPLSDRVRGSVALEVPYNFRLHQTIGLTPLAGISWTL